MLIRRLTQLYLGLALYGASASLILLSELGNDPWDVLHQGLSRQTGVGTGIWVCIAGALVMLLWIPLKEKPGLGTISNVVFVGLFADAAVYLLPTATHWVAGWLYLVLSVVSIAVATVLYIGAGLGAGPRDGIMTGLTRLGLSLRLSRLLIEITVLALGWLLGGTVGIATLVYALAIGPVTQLFARRFPLT